ncbi:MAG: ribosomal L7Ae/L30e/S12e/Gadd45 family protein [Defluviitaleaceae bacterium]|nr:ribosomal L7Ae/L30e/S12e/Gadd45 family protein [Defluviitaleaceae bacterium]MCL2837439.1 ribosomal L7Ae/L30e/S12e/Gadd45 family protein [Defluviitaleaceae bacterium]
MDKRLQSMLSLCRKAGKLCSGGFSCERALQAGKAKLVIVSGDASDNTKKKFSQKAFFYGVPYKEALTMEELGLAIGTDTRSVAVITDTNFSGKILELIGDDPELRNKEQ